MTRKELTEYLLRWFPRSVGFAVAGSQRKNLIYSEISDIDVLIFDTCNSDLYSEMGVINQVFKIDYNIVPVSDIENVIIHEFTDTRGTLFDMFLNCTILHDPFSIIQEIKEIVKGVQGITNNTTLRIAKGLYSELSTFKKYFERNLDEYERILLVAEFITVISKIGVIDKIGWDALKLRKVKQLQEHNPLLLQEIIQLFKQSLQTNNLSFLNVFIDHFLKLQRITDETQFGNIIIDFYIPKFTLYDFCKSTLPTLFENSELKKGYRYFYLSPVKYHNTYKNNISVCFELSFNQSFWDMLTELVKTISYKTGAITYQQAYVLNKFKDELLTQKIENLRKRISDFWLLNMDAINTQNKLPEDICIVLCSFMQEQLNLDFEDALCINNFLLQRWLLNRRENGNGEKMILKKAREKTALLEKYYKRNQRNVEKIFNAKNNISLIGYTFNTNSYQDIISCITDLINSNEINWNTKFFPNSLFRFLQIKKQREVKIYMVLVEEILQMMNITDNIKAKILFLDLKNLNTFFFKE